MLVQHQQTVLHIYDHEDDYNDLVAWLRERASFIFNHEYGDGITAIIEPAIEKLFNEKFGYTE